MKSFLTHKTEKPPSANVVPVDADRFAYPVFVQTFGRPAALERLLDGLLSQRCRVAPEQIWVFQDGVINPYSNEKKISFELAEQVSQTALKYVPASNLVAWPRNLGGGRLFQELLKQAFEEMKAEFAVFFEDDFQPGPYYMDALSRMVELMRRHPRIAYANALGNIETYAMPGSETVEKQGHLWGILINGRHWPALSAGLQPYYEIVASVDEVYQPNDGVLEWYRSMGLGYDSTKQDAAQAAVCVNLGLGRVNSRKAFATIQRVAGVHMSVGDIESFVVAETGTLEDARSLDLEETDLDAIIAAERKKLSADHPITPGRLRDLSIPPLRWGRQLANERLVRWLYRLILDREPSLSEVRDYVAANLSVSELRHIFLASEEYAARNRQADGS